MRGGATSKTNLAHASVAIRIPHPDFDRITPQQAPWHPTWVTGQRITIDSATMMNKGRGHRSLPL
jgi:1-deoxy-D-xylulose-5-phosphate reductoisomerase